MPDGLGIPGPQGVANPLERAALLPQVMIDDGVREPGDTPEELDAKRLGERAIVLVLVLIILLFRATVYPQARGKRDAEKQQQQPGGAEQPFLERRVGGHVRMRQRVKEVEEQGRRKDPHVEPARRGPRFVGEPHRETVGDGVMVERDARGGGERRNLRA